jgi:hypothetical protein
MTLIHTLLLLVAISELICSYDVDADLARGLVHNDSAIIGIKSNGIKILSDYPEDCAAVYRDAQALNQHVSSGIYEIWPREGIILFFFMSYSTFACCLL